MKKTQIIELFKNIKTTIVAFISIVLFVALSVAIYSGLSWVTGSLHVSVDDSLKQTNLHDVELLYTYGFDDEDIKTLSKVNNIDNIEGQYKSYESFIYNGKQKQAEIIQLSDSLDMLLECDGTLPKNNKEIAVDYYFATNNDIHIGDKIIFERSSSALANLNKLLNYDIESNDIDTLKNDEDVYYLNNDEFIVTAIIKSPKYLMQDDQHYGININNKLNIDSFFFVNKEAFNENAYCGYIDVNICNKKINENSYYSKEYSKQVNDFSNEIMIVADKLAKEKYTKIINKVDEITDNFQKQLDKANIEIQSNEKKIKNAEKQIAEAKIKLEDGEKQLKDAEDELAQARSQYNSYAELFNQATQIYNEAKTIKNEIYDFKTYISNNREDIESLAYKYAGQEAKDIVSGIIDDLLLATVETIEDYINDLFIEVEKYIEQFESQLGSANYQLNEAQNELDNGWKTYNEQLDKYNKAVIDLKNGKNKLAQAKKDYESALIDFESFKDETSDIEEISCSNLLRQQIPSFITINVMCNMYTKLRYSMAALFVVVGLLVCYSAISRIVADQTRDIGTKKALGFNQKEITLYYLIYTSITLIFGFVFGALLAYYLVEGIFIPVLNDFLTVPLKKYFNIKQMFGICSLEALLLLITTYVACRKVLKKNAITLLKGDDELKGKQRFFENWKIWKKLSLLTQTIINNCFNDPKRVLGTIVGIAGSSALIVTALTFNNNALGSFDKQFNDFYFFDSIVKFDGDENKRKQIESILKDNNVAYSAIIKDEAYIECPDDSLTTILLYAYDDLDDFKKLVHLNPFNKTNNSVDEGMWLCSSYYNFYSPKENVPIKFIDMSGKKHEGIANGYFENYLVSNYAYMDIDTYHQYMNNDDSVNAFLINTKNINLKKLQSDLIQNNIDIIEDFVAESKEAFSVFESLSSVMVLVYMILAIVMSFLVLLNLLSMFVDEKKRELIVLMINGFGLKDARRYIYSDTIVLAIFGILIGTIAGTFVGNKSIASFDTNATMFMRGINFNACIIGIIGSCILTFVVSLIALRKIKMFKLTDINKV